MAGSHEFVPFVEKISGVRDGKVYNDSVSKDVEKFVLYVAGSDPYYAYKDQACTEKVTLDEMREMFFKGVMLCGRTEWAGFYTYLYSSPFDLHVKENIDDTPVTPFGIFLTNTFNEVYSAEYVPMEA